MPPSTACGRQWTFRSNEEHLGFSNPPLAPTVDLVGAERGFFHPDTFFGVTLPARIVHPVPRVGRSRRGDRVLWREGVSKEETRNRGLRPGEKEAHESRRLERVLWGNTALDVLYVLGGVWLMQGWGAESPLWRGHGLGVVIQGGFLFFFDLYHAITLRNR